MLLPQSRISGRRQLRSQPPQGQFSSWPKESRADATAVSCSQIMPEKRGMYGYAYANHHTHGAKLAVSRGPLISSRDSPKPTVRILAVNLSVKIRFETP
jgi:hypothetical protein